MPALRLDGIWKSYPRWSAGRRSLRAILTRRMPLLARRGACIWALRDVSLAAAPGQAIGVIGSNGAGKSTLLRLAAGLGRPTRGSVSAPEGVAAVLALGDTLDPMLTGRENAMTAAVVAGWSRAQARAMLPAVLRFAELEEHAEAPVRTYSDGMKLRLAFGVVAQHEPEALLLDEVIAVGDLAFQTRCMERVREMRAGGTTLLLASHDLPFVQRECDRALWLEGGRVMASGEAAAVVEAYEEASRVRTVAATPPPEGPGGAGLELRRNRVGTQEATIEAVRLRCGADGASALATGDRLDISLDLRSHRGPIADPIVAVALHRASDGVVGLEVNTRDEGIQLGRLDAATVTLALERVDLRPGRYLLDVGLYRSDWDDVYDFHWHAYALDVTGRGPGRGVMMPPRRWEVSGAS